MEEPLPIVPKQSQYSKPVYPFTQHQSEGRSSNNGAQGTDLNSKLKLIQSNKELLEKKIMEYERKLNRISQAQHNQENVSVSMEGEHSKISNSGLSLGVTQKPANNSLLSRQSSTTKHLASTNVMSESRAALREQRKLINYM